MSASQSYLIAKRPGQSRVGRLFAHIGTDALGRQASSTTSAMALTTLMSDSMRRVPREAAMGDLRPEATAAATGRRWFRTARTAGLSPGVGPGRHPGRRGRTRRRGRRAAARTAPHARQASSAALGLRRPRHPPGADRGPLGVPLLIMASPCSPRWSACSSSGVARRPDRCRSAPRPRPAPRLPAATPRPVGGAAGRDATHSLPAVVLLVDGCDCAGSSATWPRPRPPASRRRGGRPRHAAAADTHAGGRALTAGPGRRAQLRRRLARATGAAVVRPAARPGADRDPHRPARPRRTDLPAGPAGSSRA